MLEIVKNKEFWRLPPAMSEAAQEAYDVLLHTGDGQLCDVIVDRAALEAISEAGRNAEDAIIRDYAESVVAIADIKIAVRSQKTGKSQEFLKRALAPCDTVQVEFWQKQRQTAWMRSGIICSQLPMQVGQKHWQSHRPHLSGGVTTG